MDRIVVLAPIGGEPVARCRVDASVFDPRSAPCANIRLFGEATVGRGDCDRLQSATLRHSRRGPSFRKAVFRRRTTRSRGSAI
jgi:hypothetical protein